MKEMQNNHDEAMKLNEQLDEQLHGFEQEAK